MPSGRYAWSDNTERRAEALRAQADDLTAAMIAIHRLTFGLPVPAPRRERVPA